MADIIDELIESLNQVGFDYHSKELSFDQIPRMKEYVKRIEKRYPVSITVYFYGIEIFFRNGSDIDVEQVKELRYKSKEINATIKAYGENKKVDLIEVLVPTGEKRRFFRKKTEYSTFRASNLSIFIPLKLISNPTIKDMTDVITKKIYDKS